MRILLGGSPCTFWSIAQKNNRETEASGMGWELFKNYLIAKEKFKPDYFLYENNVSADRAIKDQIKRELGVWDGTFLMPYSDVRYIEINSALVSAQNRERFYVHNCGEIRQPKDRGILLRDVLESGLTDKDKVYCLKHQAGNTRDYFKKHHTQVAFERIPEYGYADKSRPVIAGYSCKGDGEGSLADKCFTNNPNKQKVDYVAEICKVGAMPRPNGELSTSAGMRVYSTDGKGRVLIANGGGQGAKTGLYAIPVRICSMTKSQGNRIYDISAKSCAVTAQGGGLGGHTGGLYAIPVNAAENGKSHTIKAQYYKNGIANFITNDGFDASAVAETVTYNIATEFDSDGNPTKAYCYADGKIHTVYEVKDSKITIKGKEYPIKLIDGFYIIRKLTVAECRRLQTIPDWYKMPCSPTQNYKMLGNGWTVEVIKHILSHIPNITKEPIEVLSMYDGMSCGQIALKELGANVVKYYATEIDKYAIQTTMANFPDTIQLGDAFQVRNEDWTL